MTKCAADLVCDTLQGLGVTTVFGMPGTQNVPLFEGLRRSSLRTIASTSELAAAFAANGFFRASGQVGVLTTIPGPGFIMALNGIAEARLDSAGLLLITSSDEGDSNRRFGHQQVDMHGIAGPLFKQIFEVRQIQELVSVLVRAYRLAGSGEPGPVMVELRQGIYSQYGNAPDGDILPTPESEGEINEAQLDHMISEAKRPALFVGQGCASFSGHLRRLAERLNAPVLATCSGRGVLPENHPLSLTFDYSLGGGREVNAWIESSDLVLALGCKFSYNGSGGFKLKIPKDKLIHVDASEEVVGANYPARIGIVGDVGVALKSMLSRLDSISQVSHWTEQEIQGWRVRFKEEGSHLLKHVPVVQGGLSAPLEAFFSALKVCLADDACLVTDSGYHQVLARQFYSVNAPRGLIVPSDFQSMGFGIPAAIGAALAAPARKTVAIVGDGGMAITGPDLLTAVREGIDLTVIVFNDGHLGLIRLNQIEAFGHAHGVALQSTDFQMLAGAIGAGYFALDGPAAPVLERCLKAPGVNILEVNLGDSASLRWAQAKRALRSAVRRRVSPGLYSRLRKLWRGR